MVQTGILLAVLSGVCNGLFTAPMKVINRWRWENIWLVFIVTACLVMPILLVSATVPDVMSLYAKAPRGAVTAAITFGFAWGFGAILFGRSVDRLGVSLANTLVIGLSSGLGSLVPLLLGGKLRFETRQVVLLVGVATFMVGVAICGSAGRKRDGSEALATGGTNAWTGYIWAAGAGVMSAIFNIGYSLALPIAATGEAMGYSPFYATNTIWLLMLGAGSIPNLVYCGILAARNRSASLWVSDQPAKAWLLSIVMGLLWGGSIFLYGAATPQLGDLGPSIGWPLSLAIGLLTANLMGFLLGEWKRAPAAAVRLMRIGVAVLLIAVVFCALSTKV